MVGLLAAMVAICFFQSWPDLHAYEVARTTAMVLTREHLGS